MARAGHWRALARKRYGRRLGYIRGDGEWLCLFKCAERWTYSLHNDHIDADIAAGKPCGPECQGPQQHKIWRLLEDQTIAQRKAPKPEPSEDNDALLFGWEKKMGVDGL
jgi:hypothetical protein